MASARTLHVRCTTWDQVEVFHTRKLRRGKLLSMKVPFRSEPGAEVWLLIGFANTGVNFPTVAGRAYELRALADGYKPGYASVTADEWRDPKGDPKLPIDMAKKRDAIDKHIDLEVDPDAPKPTKPGRPAGKDKGAKGPKEP